MARKNRVSISNGTYHVTSRIVNREFWFRDPKLKDEIARWIYGIARFSGVELLAWCIMDNHFHLFVHVPSVPAEYRLHSDVEPDAYAFGMRPPECNVPLWSPTEEGREDRRPQVVREGLARPRLEFMLSDEEMLERLQSLYGDRRRIESMRRAWMDMRASGNGGAVDAIKSRYCRRMYNLSQFVKSLKERISQCINKRRGHVGHVFEGRFYSGLVQPDRTVEELVALYVDYNPHKARLVHIGGSYRWSSFGQAEANGPHGAACRAAYERLFGCPWKEVRARIRAAFELRIPEGESIVAEMRKGMAKIALVELIKLRVGALTRGAFIGRDMKFQREVCGLLRHNFPHWGFGSLQWLANSVQWPRKLSSHVA